ncbi:DUF6230 family protein [Salininema proteolyticum]|uniref:DUF6230 family protein n=1 Tax=Salininema proteolyticum TaxID=1607685 RepID=A0ABV8TZ46_9ACTN
MSDETPKGRTSWKKFGLLAGPALAAGVTMAALAAEGAIAANFAISSDNSHVTAERLEGEGFQQYGTVVEGTDGSQHVVAPAGIRDATIYGMCQSTVMDTPLGEYTLVVKAGYDEDNPVTAENLVLYIDELRGDASFGDIQVGLDASTVDKVPGNTGGQGGFAQQSNTITVNGAEQNAWYVTAGTFNLNGLDVQVVKGVEECY